MRCAHLIAGPSFSVPLVNPSVIISNPGVTAGPGGAGETGCSSEPGEAGLIDRPGGRLEGDGSSADRNAGDLRQLPTRQPSTVCSKLLALQMSQIMPVLPATTHPQTSLRVIWRGSLPQYSAAPARGDQYIALKDDWKTNQKTRKLTRPGIIFRLGRSNTSYL